MGECCYWDYKVHLNFLESLLSLIYLSLSITDLEGCIHAFESLSRNDDWDFFLPDMRFV